MLARDEFDPDGPVAACRVEEVFVREELIWELTAGGRTIRTTAEHPHCVPGRGWVACHELRVGDRVLTELGTALPVEALRDTRSLERVYNFRVADTHTYFVGAPEWGFAVWVHNAKYIRVASVKEVSSFTKAKGFTKNPNSRAPLRLTVPAEQKKIVKNLREAAAGKKNYTHIITITANNKKVGAFIKQHGLKAAPGHHPKSVEIPQSLINDFNKLIESSVIRPI